MGMDVRLVSVQCVSTMLNKKVSEKIIKLEVNVLS